MIKEQLKLNLLLEKVTSSETSNFDHIGNIHDLLPHRPLIKMIVLHLKCVLCLTPVQKSRDLNE